MQPSSLIFVAIVAIWAAFLVQHWVRRREHMATARSVDRFSESIRMLERQAVVPSPSPRPQLQAYAVASPFVARSRAAVPDPAPPSAVAVSPTGPPERAAGPGASRSRGDRLARRVRGITFLAVLALLPVTVALSALGVLVWASVGVSLGALVGAVFLLRYAAVRERTRRRLDRSIAASLQRSLAPAGRAPGPLAEPTEGAAPAAPGSAAATGSAARPAARVEPPAAGTWSPVPVPPPTYTLKARATRPVEPDPTAAPDEASEASARGADSVAALEAPAGPVAEPTRAAI